jgi:hypothetical protein
MSPTLHIGQPVPCPCLSACVCGSFSFLAAARADPGTAPEALPSKVLGEARPTGPCGGHGDMGWSQGSSACPHPRSQVPLPARSLQLLFHNLWTAETLSSSLRLPTRPGPPCPQLKLGSQVRGSQEGGPGRGQPAAGHLPRANGTCHVPQPPIWPTAWYTMGGSEAKLVFQGHTAQKKNIPDLRGRHSPHSLSPLGSSVPAVTDLGGPGSVLGL